MVDTAQHKSRRNGVKKGGTRTNGGQTTTDVENGRKSDPINTTTPSPKSEM